MKTVKKGAKMKKVLISFMMVLMMAGVANAIPTLQLDIAGGIYDPVTETVVASSNPFNLYTYLLPKTSNTISLLADTYYLSMALVPKTTPPGGSLGSFDFTFNGVTTTVNVTSSMTYGVPPIERFLGNIATHDGGDLGDHGIFDTYFYEFSFQFDSAKHVAPYNTAPTDPDPTTKGTKMYYQMFTIDTTNLQEGYFIHFDLYNENLAKNSTTDLDINKFAPFSHDAQSNGHKVPEPSTLLLLGSGLLGFGIFARRRMK